MPKLVPGSSPTPLRVQALIGTNSNTSPQPGPSGYVSLRKGCESSVSIPESNDDNERAARRSNVDLQKRLSIITTVTSPFREFAHLGMKEITEEIKICMKLYTENKITVRNAWKLQIIDCMQQYVAKDTNNNGLQMACTSLDIGSKVYGCRVDDVYDKGLQMARHMAKTVHANNSINTTNPNVSEMDNDADQDGDQGVQKKKSKKRRRRLDQKASIYLADPENLVGDVTKLDSVDFRTTQDAAFSTVDNLLTDILPLHRSTHKIVVMSDDLHWPPADNDPALNQSEDTLPIKIQCLPRGTTICMQFKNFVLDQWNPDEEDRILNDDWSMTVEGEGPPLDEDGFPIPELDGSVHDCFANDNQNDDDVDNYDDDDDDDDDGDIIRNGPVSLGPAITNVLDVNRDDLDFDSLYGYLKVGCTPQGAGRFQKLWAGPSHWKYKYIKSGVARYSGSVAKILPRRATKRTVYELLDLSQTVKKPDFNKFVTNRQPMTVPEDRITLPIRYDHWLEFLKPTLLTKPEVTVISMAHRQPVTDDDAIDCQSAYNYDNPDDSMYCCQNDGSQMEGQEPVAYDENNLLEAPYSVPHAALTYKLQPRKMNMKKLKRNVWKCITNNERNTDRVETTYVDTFTAIYKSAKDDTKSELSPHLVFSAILHLCNENNLQLIQHMGKNNFSIQNIKQ